MSSPEGASSPDGPVVLLAGGLSHERDVSLRSGRRSAEALRAVGVDVIVRDVDAHLLAALADDRPSAVLPMLHGAPGEDGAIRDVLELLGLPYVGSRAEPCRLSFDKPVAKAVLARTGALTPPAVALPHQTFRELGAAGVMDAVVARLGLPLVVKPARGGSALGVTVVREPAGLPEAMMACFAYGETALVERHIEGVELAVSVVDGPGGPRALPAVEIVPDGGVYDYAARYTAGATEFFAPARVSAEVAEACAALALSAHAAYGLRDLSRTDLIVDAEGRPWFLEVNVSPGMTETSLFPQAVHAAGEDLGALLAGLVHQASARGRQG